MKREAVSDRLYMLPDELKRLNSWLLWKFIPDPGGKKPRKVPYYATGRRRNGVQGGPEDRANLASFNKVMDVFERGDYSGLGIAMLPELDLVGIDLDNCVVDRKLNPEMALLVEGTYCEISPSGNGVRAFFSGRYDNRKHLDKGVEVFCSNSFLTITGDRLSADGISPLSSTVKRRLDAIFDQQKKKNRQRDPLSDSAATDPVYKMLIGQGVVRKDFGNGKIGIECPFASEHTTGDGDADCVYYLPHFNGYPKGHFHCFHAHCTERPQADFLKKIGIDQQAGFSGPWGEPQPLVSHVPAAPYPVDALPDGVRQAVKEVQAFVKAPVALVAASALSALSLAIQGHVDIERTKGLTGPVGLYLLSIAESGERKTQIDRQFMEPVELFVRKRTEAAKPEVMRWEALKGAWSAKQSALLEQIKKLTKADQHTGELEKKLIELQQAEPIAPRWPRILLKDDTPERLAQTLAKVWPSAGVVSSEAGIIFGAHGMSPDVVMRNLSQLNVLWDGGTLDMGRKVVESIRVEGGRLTLGLQIQEATLQFFFERTQGLARGTGFLARFLISWPESAMGSRMFSDPPENWPALSVFNNRVLELLNLPLPIDDESFTLAPRMLSMTPDAKRVWVRFHDAIEQSLCRSGELREIKDVAAKSADNAVRVAGLFHVFAHGPQGCIGLEAFESAARVVSWHLNESLRFFGEIAMPVELSNATRLDSWLLDYCKRNGTLQVPTVDIQRYGPRGIRKKEALENVVADLSELNRVRLAKDGKCKIVEVNPTLVKGAA